MPTTLIPEAEIEFHPTSYADSNGQLFYWKGKLFRGIGAERSDWFKELFERGIIAELQDQKLLSSARLTDYSTEQFSLVIEHDLLPFVSYSYEWTVPMLRDAALCVLKLEAALRRKGLALQDAHSGNVLFHHAQPLWVDLGSIGREPIPELWQPNGEFRRFFVYPLVLLADNQERVARLLMQELKRNVLLEEVNGLSPRWQLWKKREILELQQQRAKNLMARAKRKLGGNSKSARVAGLHRPLRELEVNLAGWPAQPQNTNWVGYYSNEDAQLDDASTWDIKRRGVADVLEAHKPRTFLDVGCAEGWYSKLAAQSGCEVLALDFDAGCVERLYLDAQKSKDAIHPVLFDFTAPSPGLGPCNREQLPALQRHHGEMVIALALVHHLVFKGHLKFWQIAQTLDALVGDTLIVEFVPPDDQFVSQWMTPAHHWYKIENFIAELRKFFGSVEVKPSHPEPRVLVICRREEDSN